MRRSSLDEQETPLLPLESLHQVVDSPPSSVKAAQRTYLTRESIPAPRQEVSSRDDEHSSTSPSQPGSSGTSSPALAGEDLSNNGISSSIIRKIYISHFVSTWNFRGFEFGAILFLASIYPGTLLPMSVYALVRAASAIVLAPTIGRYIDTANRLRVVRSSIVWQRAAVVASCSLFWIMKTQKESLPNWGMTFLMAANILLACIEKLCAIMNTVSVERDWIIVIASDQDAALRQINSMMRRIDLLCKLLSPLVIAILDGFSTTIAILVTLAINSVSMGLEYGLIARVYKAVPALAHDRALASSEGDETPDRRHKRSVIRVAARVLMSFVESIRTYTSQEAFLPSLSLSISYLTVLSFAGQMVTYLIAAGYTSASVGVIRIFSTACEISATWLAPWLMSKIGPVRSGIWFLSFQMICLGIAVAAFWTAQLPIWAPSALVVGTALSRIGLWGFDLSAQVIIQEEVDSQHRGTFSTTEAALQNFFELCAYASTVIFFRPSDFKYPATMSIFAVYTAGALYAKFVRDRRGHLFHSSKCMQTRDKVQAFSCQVSQTSR